MLRSVLATLALVLGLAAQPAWSQIQPCNEDIPIPIIVEPLLPICPGTPTRLVARTCGPCYDLIGWAPDDSGHVVVSARRTLQCIPAVCTPESLLIQLGTVSPGHYTIPIRIELAVLRPDSSACLASTTQRVSFDVPNQCASGPLPYVDEVVIGPEPICPDRPIPFAISGTFPSDCYEFRGLQLLPSPLMTPLPEPPIVRAVIAYNDCLGRPCNRETRPWRATAMLPGLPPRGYRLITEVALVSWCDSTGMPDSLYSTSIPFTVAQQCSIPRSPDCFLHAWNPPMADSAGNCTARITPGGTAPVTLRLWTGTVLGGLQGRFALDPNALQVTNIRPVGIAEGMQLAWAPNPAGASFVLFSSTGRTFHSPCIPPAMCPPQTDPVLEISVTPRPGAPIPAVTLLDVHDLLAADSLGREVRECPTFAPIPPARICAGPTCDFNADGHADVRDLVLMARCLNGSIRCDPGSFDCNRDGAFTVDDIVCCARVILRGTLPDSAESRPAPELRAALGTPVPSSGALEVPLHIDRADLVGSARLGITYPAGTYGTAAVEVLGDAASWLAVSEAANGELVVGLVALAPEAQMPVTLELRLRFTTTAGQTPGGTVRLSTAEFVAPDGAVLISGTPVSVPGGPGRLALSPARPNPFGREARFTLSAAQAADADLGIFDLAGRRIATLHRGPLAAGDHDFTWDGRHSDGARVADGVYFYRAEGAGTTVTRRLVLLRTR